MTALAVSATPDWAVARYQALSVRERLLVALAVLGVTWLGWSVTVGAWAAGYATRTEAAATALDQRLELARAERARLAAAARHDPDAPLAAEVASLEDDLRRLEAALGATLERFVAPERMPQVLEDVVRQHSGVRLQRAQSLPVEPVALTRGNGAPVTVAAGAEDGAAAGALTVYRHPLRLELEGGYFELMSYLQALEQGPWRFGWRELDYAVRQHPRAQLTLELETLSRERRWIGI
jgi:MSHA biogenesis protein MshJ